MSALSVLLAQLDDPTRVLHGIGVVTIVGEVLRHWITKQPVDTGTIGAGIGCFAVGGTIDHFQAKDLTAQLKS